MVAAPSESSEKISRQAIQELLDFSRLNIAGIHHRAASPDSRISSRSSSPHSSSGRTSPGMFLFHI